MVEYDIPKVQKAVVVVEQGEKPIVQVVDDYPVPEPKEGEMLVRLTSSGVCHSDISYLQDYWSDVGAKMTVKVAGHEGSGYIVKYGPAVDGIYPLGTKVGVPLHTNPCRVCENCRMPDGEIYCQNSPYYGAFFDGTWQQYCIIKEKYTIPLPEVKDTAEVGPILCGGVTAYRALKKSELRSGQWIVITGAGGGLGSMAIQFAREMGLRIIAVDTGDDKAALTKKIGAEVFVDFMKENVVETIIKVSDGLGAHGVIMFAPVQRSYNEALSYLRNLGRLVCVGLPKANVKVEYDPVLMVVTGKSIVGSFVGTRSDMLEALDFVARDKVHPPIEVKPMEDIQSIIEDMIQGKIVGRVVISLD